MRVSKLLRGARIALSPKSAVLSSLTPNGATLLGLNRPGYGGRGLYLEGDDLEPEVSLLPRLLSPDAVLIDVGANTGLYTLTAAQHFRSGSGTVVALEPNIEILAMLSRSVARNGFESVRLRALCASDTSGEVAFYRNFGRPNQFSMETLDAAASQYSALAVTLDELVGWERLERLDYVKIDAEGSEDRILRGAEVSVTRFRPIIQVEDSVRPVRWLPDSYVPVRMGRSQNRLLIPEEHPKRQLLGSLGARLSHGEAAGQP